VGGEKEGGERGETAKKIIIIAIYKNTWINKPNYKRVKYKLHS
jgi:hypothetical protein